MILLAFRPSSCFFQLLPPSSLRMTTPSWPTIQPRCPSTKKTFVKSTLTGDATCVHASPSSLRRICPLLPTATSSPLSSEAIPLRCDSVANVEICAGVSSGSGKLSAATGNPRETSKSEQIMIIVRIESSACSVSRPPTKSQTSGRGGQYYRKGSESVTESQRNPITVAESSVAAVATYNNFAFRKGFSF